MLQQNDEAPSSNVPVPMDAKKAVDEAKTYIKGLPSMHFKKELLTKMTEKWENDHELDNFSRGAINDAKAIKILIFSVRILFNFELCFGRSNIHAAVKNYHLYLARYGIRRTCAHH